MVKGKYNKGVMVKSKCKRSSKLLVHSVMVKGKCTKERMLFVDCVMVNCKCKKICYC